MDAPFHDDETFYAWLASLAKWEQDAVLDFRGPKGRGKSNGMFYVALRIDPKLTPAELLLFLCYNKEQYAKVYRMVREQRKTESVRPKFIWGDDADQLFDRRAHSTQGNRAMLGLVRKARDQLRSIQMLGTQDDFLEGPLSVGGTFVRIVFEAPGEGKVYWPRRDKMQEGIDKWDYVFTLVFPNPHETYPESWKQYQVKRRELTSDGTTELLLVLDPNGPERQAENPTLKDAIRNEWMEAPKGTPVTEICRRLRAKGQNVSYNYARDCISTFRATTTTTGDSSAHRSHGEPGVLPAANQGATPGPTSA